MSEVSAPSKGKGFTVRNVVPQWVESGNITGPRQPPQKGDVISLEAECNDCGAKFTARRSDNDSPGAFRSLGTSDLRVTCSMCGQQAQMKKRDLLHPRERA